MELSGIQIAAIVFPVILISVILHEVMHGMVALWLGDDTAYHSGRLTLNPLKHIDPFMTLLLPLLLAVQGLPPFGAAKPVPFNPARLKYDEYGAALVAIAGPLTNLFIAIVCGFWLRFVVGINASGEVEASLGNYILSMFVNVNVAFALFNLIPFPPLDGSRVLFAFAPDGLRSIMRSIESMGIMAIFIFYLIFMAVGIGFLGFWIDKIISLILGV